jgi:RNA polymerase sigma-70 factor (ECF subfamily)
VDEADPVLIRRAAAGDLDAFEQLVRCYQQHVWRVLRRLLGDASLAEDVTQETFIRVYRRLPDFSFESKFSTWVIQIARNAGIDEIRSRERRSRLVTLAPAPAPPAAPPGARLEVEAALASLPVHLREVVVLVEVLGLRYRDVSMVLGVPEGTVKSRMFAARSQLHRWATAGETEGASGEM